jgi:hypothetical protein
MLGSRASFRQDFADSSSGRLICRNIRREPLPDLLAPCPAPPTEVQHIDLETEPVLGSIFNPRRY